MKNSSFIISTGFALFSMFFGSGNLVFPITVGVESEGHYLFAALGILLTGVIVPFLGIFAMLLYNGNLAEFFSCLGKKGTFLFSFLGLALLGPFGVLPRCLTVAHGALQLLLPHLSLPLASLLMSLFIYLMTVNKNKIVDRLGSILTPFLLLAMGAIGFVALSQGSFPSMTTLSGWNAFKNGFFQGYQLMDLLAAFFFAQFMVQHIQDHVPSNHRENFLHRHFYKSLAIGGGLLASVYFVLVLLGWMYAPLLQNVPRQEMLGMIAMASLGGIAAPCVCLAVIFACLTTAIVFTSLFADFLRFDVMKGKLTHKPALFLTLATSFAISTFDFSGIAGFLGPIMELIYPALIALTLANIACKWLSLKPSHWPFTSAVVMKLLSI